MSIREELKAKTISAMKEKQEERLLILRSISAGLKDADIAARGKGNNDGIPDAEIMSMLQGMVKKRNDSIEMYRQGKREDLIAKEESQIKVIGEFLPKQMSEEEMKKAIVETIKKTGAGSIKDMGKVMAALKESYAGQMDFSKASALIKASF